MDWTNNLKILSETFLGYKHQSKFVRGLFCLGIESKSFARFRVKYKNLISGEIFEKEVLREE